jgi:hypothetical protein
MAANGERSVQLDHVRISAKSPPNHGAAHPGLRAALVLADLHLDTPSQSRGGSPFLVAYLAHFCRQRPSGCCYIGEANVVSRMTSRKNGGDNRARVIKEPGVGTKLWSPGGVQFLVTRVAGSKWRPNF